MNEENKYNERSVYTEGLNFESILIKLSFSSVANYNYKRLENQEELQCKNQFSCSTNKIKQEQINDDLFKFCAFRLVNEIFEESYDIQIINMNNFFCSPNYLFYQQFFFRLAIDQNLCMIMMLTNQNAEEKLKVLENICKYKITFKEKDNNFVSEPQKKLKKYAENVAEYYLSRNPKLIEYYSTIDLTPVVTNSIYHESEQCLRMIQEYKQKEEKLVLKNKQFIEDKSQKEQINYEIEFYKFINKHYNSCLNTKQKQITSQTKLNQEQQNEIETSTQIFNNQTSDINTQKDYSKELQKEKQSYEFLTEKYESQKGQNFIEISQQEQQQYIQWSDKQTISYKQIKIQNQIKDDETILANNNQQKQNDLEKETNNYILYPQQQEQTKELFNTQEMKNVTQEQTNLEEQTDDNSYTYSENNQRNTNRNQLSLIEKRFDLMHLNQLTQKLINSNGMLKIGILGQGGQGNVELYYDFKNKKRYALKCFSDSHQYLAEKKIHIKYLLEDKNSILASYVCQLVSFKDSDCQLLFEIGLCSLNEANQILQKNNYQISTSYFVNILIKIISFNIQMNKIKLFHGDIKPQNIVIYYDQDEQAVQQELGFLLYDFRNVQIKLIDFGSCSDDLCDYYGYVTKKYKYLGYFNQELDFQKMLFAETYSACKSIYFLLDEQLIQKMQNFKCDLKQITCQQSENTQENKLLFFLLMFLGQNQVQSIFSENGISIDILIYLTQKYLGQVDETNQHFKFDFFDALQRGQWNKIQEIEYSTHNQSVEYKIICAFAFRNNLKAAFSEQFVQQDNLNQKISKIQSLIQSFEIVATYDSFSEEELYFIEQDIAQKYHILTEESYLQFLQLACMLYCHSQKNNCNSIIKIILEKNVNRQSNQVLDIILDIFKHILNEIYLNIFDLIEKIYFIEIQEQNYELFNSIFYEFIITFILEQQSDFDEETSLIILDILERIISNQNLNIFQKKFFTHIYLYFSHCTQKDDDKKYFKIFLNYKQMCKDLTAVLEYDSILFYNYRIKKSKQKDSLPININEATQQSNTSKKADLKLKAIALKLNKQKDYELDLARQFQRYYDLAIEIF
ncbi:hypothetical protein TTHERM_01068130 (macronuclear) [Tetrahymena thermophila SB210]|uniref:Protein kinase domain-containing protein n=1 Tax=Tetrahymena thermophila (strain SB210) TaxID=312017 RepID=Q22C97_TETTS|nr:hypothetical protein TTHERM_01068130 [Tetrahymena thermophila SB210]EAR82910.2 hypothetical protein TTHERM_01068130 [Tetrahymena thermophila SB210]|eukprot:XP_001030573.2 hypothetical protein TTHERM_01068130 [Tetrahymena thermophila SB210]